MQRTVRVALVVGAVLTASVSNAIAADYIWEHNFSLVEIIKDMIKNREFRKSAPGKTIEINEFDLAAMDRSTFANGGPLIVQSTSEFGRAMISKCVIRDETIAAREAQNQKVRTVRVYGTIASVGDGGLVIDPCFIK